MLQRARAKATDSEIEWIEFEEADIANFATDDRFDVATCGFSIQFFPDIVQPVATMIQHLRPGGRVAISMWAEGFIAEHRAEFLGRVPPQRLLELLQRDLLGDAKELCAEGSERAVANLELDAVVGDLAELEVGDLEDVEKRRTEDAREDEGEEEDRFARRHQGDDDRGAAQRGLV